MNRKILFPMQLIIVEDEGASTFCFQIPEDYPYFEGHFPGNPIVPGVTQMGWIIRGLERLKGMEIYDYRVSKFKFNRPVRPLAEVAVRIEGSGEAYLFKIEADGELCSSGMVTIGSEHS